MKKYAINENPQGWHFRSTPGHGYLQPSAEANNNVPALIRESEYEEDCAYVIPIFFNPDLFTDEAIKKAEQTFKNWFPDEYEKIFKRELQRGESSMKDQNYFARLDNLGKYESCTGYGDWCFDVPKGMVYRIARKVTAESINPGKIFNSNPDEISFLISKEKDTTHFFDSSEVILYKRDETFYTWESYTKATGQERYK